MLSDLTLQPRPPAKSHPVSLCTPELEGLRETGDGDGGHTGSLVRAGVAVRAGRRHTSSGEVSEVFTVPPSRCHVTRCHRQTWSLGTRSASPSSLGQKVGQGSTGLSPQGLTELEARGQPSLASYQRLGVPSQAHVTE